MGEQRPPVWVGHVGPVEVADLAAAVDFYAALGLRRIHGTDSMAAMQLRGGTHLVLVVGDAAPGPAPFDLMVEDLDDFHAGLVHRGLSVGAIEQRRNHRSFRIEDPDGHDLAVHDSHVVGPA